MQRVCRPRRDVSRPVRTKPGGTGCPSRRYGDSAAWAPIGVQVTALTASPAPATAEAPHRGDPTLCPFRTLPGVTVTIAELLRSPELGLRLAAGVLRHSAGDKHRREHEQSRGGRDSNGEGCCLGPTKPAAARIRRGRVHGFAAIPGGAPRPALQLSLERPGTAVGLTAYFSSFVDCLRSERTIQGRTFGQ